MLNLGPWNIFFMQFFWQDNITFSYESEYMNFKKFIFHGTNPLKGKRSTVKETSSKQSIDNFFERKAMVATVSKMKFQDF